MAFKDLKTPEEIKAYLLDVIDRTLKQNKDACIYHYTDFTTIYKIISSGYIWLGSTQQMNDFFEGSFIEEADGRYTTYFACFSKAEENLAMYKMYAPNPNGAILVIPLSIAQSMIDELPETADHKKILPIVRNNIITTDTTQAHVYWAAVAYKELHGDTLRLNNQKNENIDDPLQINELAGFIKLHGWEYEKEVRLVAHIFNELTDEEKVAVKLPTGYRNKIRIITGPAFDKIIHRGEVASLKRKKIPIHESEYDALVDLGGSLKNEDKKRIVELERTNEELKSKIKTLEEKIIENNQSADSEEYKRAYIQLRSQAIRVLALYADVYTNIIEDPDDLHENASKALRATGVEFEVFAKNKRYDSPEIPTIDDLLIVSGEFIGLSNNMYIYKGGDPGRLLDDNIRREEKIKEILGI